MITKQQKEDKRLAFVSAVCNWGQGDLRLANEWYRACNGSATPNDILKEKYRVWLASMTVPLAGESPRLLMDVEGRMYVAVPPKGGDAGGWVRVFGSTVAG